VVAVIRLGRSALRSRTQQAIAVGAALAAIASPLGTAVILVMAGAVGLLLFHSRRAGAAVIVLILAAVAVAPLISASPLGAATADTAPRLGKIMSVFAAIGALTFGGGLSMIALIQETIVSRLSWLTPEEFIAGLALGQLTPGPVLMIAAYVGYKVLGIGGAIAAVAAVFAPAFALMIVLLPLYDRARNLAWAKAVLQGIVPGVIGVMAIALTRMTPHAVPDVFAAAVLVATVAVMLMRPIGPIKVLLAGSVVGVVRQRWLAFAFK
jgi:chromate transporter